jgi:hypothetical protein
MPEKLPAGITEAKCYSISNGKVFTGKGALKRAKRAQMRLNKAEARSEIYEQAHSKFNVGDRNTVSEQGFLRFLRQETGDRYEDFEDFLERVENLVAICPEHIKWLVDNMVERDIFTFQLEKWDPITGKVVCV